MRKLLLASAAVLGGTVGFTGLASAQQTNLPPSWNQGVVSAPGGISAANNNNNYQAAMLPPGPAKNPTPGSIVTRLAGRVVFYGAVQSSSLDTTAGVGPANTGAAKLNPYTTLGYARFYFGMDGMMTNGVRYGGSIEVRVNAGPAAASYVNNGSSGNTTTDTLYVRRAFGYVAQDNVGIFRFGQGDGPWGIFDNGITTQQGFDDGGWNGDLPGAIPGNAAPPFPFLSQQGAEYGSSKLVYLSPQLAGFDFGVSWAPNNAALQDGNCSFASAGCYNLSSSSDFATQASRFTNMYELAARYQNAFGPVGVYAYGGYMGSGQVSYTGPITAATPGWNPLSLGTGGIALTIGGVTFGGNVQGGQTNGVGALQPKGGVHAIAWIAGVQYSTGPFTIGNSYFQYDSQGSPSLVGVSQRHEFGYAAGMTYGIAPGLTLWVSYIYGQRHQGDFNFQTGASGGGYAYNDVKSQAFGIGTMVRW
ncbi:MAG: hypothetical protein JSR21_06865 [Proteobacteria bacterium]|nr:hypothetical protein [Pseudomonadota bacterium]